MHAIASPLSRPRTSILLLAGVSLLSLGVLLAANAWRPRQSAPIYPLAVVWQQTQTDPTRWLGRTVRVRAIAVPCTALAGGPGSPCLDPRPALIDPDPRAEVLVPLASLPAPSNGLSLSSLPLLDRFAPTPVTPAWGVTAIYTIQMRRCLPSSSTPCYEAVLHIEATRCLLVAHAIQSGRASSERSTGGACAAYRDSMPRPYSTAWQ